jgi:hypothetical protein
VTVTGRGISTDILEASARAYLEAINRAMTRPGARPARRGKRTPRPNRR